MRIDFEKQKLQKKNGWKKNCPKKNLAKIKLDEKKNWAEKKIGPKKKIGRKKYSPKYWLPHPQGHDTIHAAVFEKIKCNIQKYNIKVDQTSNFQQGQMVYWLASLQGKSEDPGSIPGGGSSLSNFNNLF